MKMARNYRLSNPAAGRGAAPAAPSDPAGAAPARGGGRGAPPVPTVNPEATPIVINGARYLPAGGRVLAPDAGRGNLVWAYTLPTRSTGSRGVPVWPWR